MKIRISQIVRVSFYILNSLVLLNCRLPEPSLPADGVRANTVEARRFDLMVVSKNKWRVADGSIDARETEAFYTRRETPSNGALLLRAELTGTVFLYNRLTGQLELSTQEKWDASSDNIAQCVGNFIGLGDMDGQPEHQAVLWKSQKDLPIQVTVDISGRQQWGDMLLSPTKRKLAVFSFDGAYKPQNFLFGTSQVLRGSRHIDFFEIVKAPEPGTFNENGRPQVLPVGKSVLINDPTESVSLTPCWTPDEQFIVIPDISSPWLWIVEIELEQKQKS
jgi:hypothetical protein